MQPSGQIVLAVYDSEESWMDESLILTYRFVPVRQVGDIAITFDLPKGNYAISVYHDVNGDKKLNTNLMGIPKEPYGFSNDARATFSAPPYEDAMFTLNGPTQSTISLK